MVKELRCGDRRVAQELVIASVVRLGSLSRSGSEEPAVCPISSLDSVGMLEPSLQNLSRIEGSSSNGHVYREIPSPQIVYTQRGPSLDTISTDSARS